MGVSLEVSRDTQHGIESLTACQANKSNARVRTVIRNTARPAIESLTCWQVNMTRVQVSLTVNMDTAGPDSESLTRCQANRTKVGLRTVKEHRWTLHGITHFLSSQQDQS